MHELYELKEMLMKELEEYGSKGEMSTGTLEVVDKLAHAAKNVGKIIEMCEEDEEYSGAYDDGGMSMRGGSYARGGRSYDGGGSYRYGSYARGRSYARGGRGGSYAQRRDSMGRYSRAEMNEMVSELRELMEDAPDERTKKEFQKFIQKIEGM